MKRSFRSLVAASALVLSAIAAIDPLDSALAQTAGTSGPVSLGDLFGEGASQFELREGAADRFRNAARDALSAGDSLAPGQCPKPKITVTAELDDELMRSALAAARRDVLQELVGNDAGRFTLVIDGTVSVDNVEIDASVADGGPPTIAVDPPSRTKVRVGQRLTITATAAEPGTGWQAGIKEIRIEDLERHTNLPPWINPAAAPRPCGNVGLTQEIKRSYVVPNVPVARLKITARDYHHPQQTLTVEYPTGDLSGTFDMTTFTAGRDAFRARADIVLNHDGRGNLTGTMVGQLEHVDYSTPGCSFRMVQPNRFRVSLVGSFTERSAPASGPTIKVSIGDVQETALTVEAGCGGETGGPIGPPGGWKFKTAVWGVQEFLGTPGPFGDGEVLPDGTRQYRLVSETGGVGSRWAVTLRRARN